MNKLLRCAAAAVCVGFFPTGALAQASNLTFRMKSNHPNKVQVEFYAQSRNHAWPGGTKAYNLDDYNEHSFTLNCRTGEKICYGAWLSGNQKRYWGVGMNDKQSCTGCCTTCNGGTISFTLNP
jgi:hypothetical protein